MCATRCPRGYERHFHRDRYEHVLRSFSSVCSHVTTTALATPLPVKKTAKLLAANNFNYEQSSRSRYRCACVQQDPVPTEAVLENTNTRRRGRKREETSSSHPHRGYPVQGGMCSALCHWSLRGYIYPPMAILQDPTLRYRIWKILLRVNDLPAETFLEYVARGPCEVREKIRNDTFRCVAICPIAESLLMLQQSFSTLATDRGFKERVREDMLVRLLDAFVWRNHGKSHCSPFSILRSPLHRQTRVVPAARLYLRAGHERFGCPLSLYHAFRTGSFLLLCKIYRRVLSTLCSTYSRGCPSWSEGSCHYGQLWPQFLHFYASNSFSTDALRLWTQNCTTACAQRIFLPNYMLFLVSALALTLR